MEERDSLTLANQALIGLKQLWTGHLDSTLVGELPKAERSSSRMGLFWHAYFLSSRAFQD